jgi:hypothetical protein
MQISIQYYTWKARSLVFSQTFRLSHFACIRARFATVHRFWRLPLLFGDHFSRTSSNFEFLGAFFGVFPRKMDNILLGIRALGLAGRLVSAYALYVERQIESDPMYVPSCNTRWGSCVAVFRSSYAHLLSHWGLVQKVRHPVDLCHMTFVVLCSHQLLCAGRSARPVTRKRRDAELWRLHLIHHAACAKLH